MQTLLQKSQDEYKINKSEAGACVCVLTAIAYS